MIHHKALLRHSCIKTCIGTYYAKKEFRLCRKGAGSRLRSQFSCKNKHDRRLILKKAPIVLLALIVVALALNVQAASVTFDPEVVKLRVVS